MRGALESLRTLSDEAVIARMKQCVASERQATAALIAILSELDLRRLYLREGYGSLFDYCTRSLRLSERAACSRIAAARLSRRFPIIVDLIADSRVSLTAVSLLAKHLNEANHRSLLEEATHKTAAEVERIVARLAPKPDAPAVMRRVTIRPLPVLPVSGIANQPTAAPTPPSAVPPPARPAFERHVVKPLAPERYKIQFTISEETRGKLRLTQELLRHAIPAGDVAAIFDRALSALLADLERKKLALVARPRQQEPRASKGSRLIPASVRRGVWARDKGRCAFVGTEGRCRERSFLELHHVTPHAAGGEATVENIQLRCRAHNAYEAETYFSMRL